MNTLLIGYDLNKAGQNYENLIDEIKTIANGYWHHLDSTWIIKTYETHITACNKLKQHIDGNDELLVINISGDAAAWKGFNQAGSEWLANNI